MSEDRHSNGEVRALRVLVDELREEAPPTLDWDRLEQRLLRQVDLEQKAHHQHPSRGHSSHWGSLCAFAAAAAAVALLLVGQDSAPLELATAAGNRGDIVNLDELRANQADDGSPSYGVKALSPGSVVSSGDESVRFTLPGVASWVLDPHSRVVVESVALPHVIKLQQGTVHAEVVPRHDSNELVEAFAVEMGTTRVAVHGTAFSVERHRDHVKVAVSRGSVAVGPTGHQGVTSRHLLIGPARASFSLEGGRLIEALPITDRPLLAQVTTAEQAGQRPMLGQTPSVQDAAPVTEDGAAEALDPSRRAVQPDGVPATNAPTGAEREPPATDHSAPVKAGTLDVTTAQALVISCLRSGSESAGASKLRLTISSQVTVTADGDGKVAAVRFVPPLRPDLQQRCGSALFGRQIATGPTLSFRIDVAAQ